MSFPTQIALATLVVAASVGGLVVLGRNAPPAAAPTAPTGAPAPAASAPSPAPSSPDAAGLGSEGAADLRPSRVLDAPARALVPPHAWLVADFQGDLVGQLPFADQPGLCSKVPAPERVAVAFLPPASANGPGFLIAAPAVDETFWGCVRDRIVRAGGDALAENDRYEVLKSPSGLVARGPNGSMVFLNDEAQLEAALSTLSGLSEGASQIGPHAIAYERTLGEAQAGNALDLTVVLPSGWLKKMGRDGAQSPLRFISTAFLSMKEDGSAQGGIDCVEEGCSEVLSFLERVKKDLISSLPAPTGAAIESSLQAKHVVGAGRIALTWTPTRLPLGSLLSSLLPGGSATP